MKIAVFASAFSILAGLALVGCGDSSSSAPPADGVAPGGTAGADPSGGMVAPGGPTAGGPSVPLGGGNKGGGAQPAGGGAGSRSTSFDGAPENMKKLWGGAGAGQSMPPMGGGAGMGGGGGAEGPKPTPIRPGIVALASRKDPFESLFKPVVQISPAWDYVINHRTAPEPKYLPEPTTTGDPNIDLPPLPPVPRRIAGVFYNGGITAILETGTPPDSEIDIVQPGAEIVSQIPGIPTLTVESITMDSLILRAKDGRTVEVKLSGLAPAVREALRQQFGSNTGAGGGMGPGGMGPGGMGPGAMGPGGAGGGAKGGGAPLQ